MSSDTFEDTRESSSQPGKQSRLVPEVDEDQATLDGNDRVVHEQEWSE